MMQLYLRYRLIIVVLFSFHISWSVAQQTKNVKHTILYYAPLNMSLDEAKHAAVEQAQSEAISQNFGKIISQHTFTDAMIVDGHEVDNFQMLSSSIAKGIWVQDIEEPKFTRTEIQETQHIIVVEVTVHGKIREIQSAPIDLKVSLLRNATDLRNEEVNFREGDDMYIYFHSPEDGYLVVYVGGNNGLVQTLLPLDDNGGSVRIKANKEYMFFGKDDEFTSNYDGLTLTCDGNVEYNRFFFVFSPNPLSKARDTKSKQSLDAGLVLPRELPEKAFREWLTKNMDHDSRLNVVLRDVKIVDKSTPRGL